MNIHTQVLVIGAGATGAGIFRDLALRGVPSVLVEKKDVNAGASGGNHGLLHSGARYVASDAHAAAECRIESDLLKKTASHCIENTGGLFTAFEGDDAQYARDFPLLCDKCGIPYRKITREEALSLEPSLSKQITHAYQVQDATIDPFKLVIDTIAHAEKHGGEFYPYQKVVRLEISRDRVQKVRLLDMKTGAPSVITADVVVNASGVWAGEIAAMAGISFNMLFSKGSLLVTHKRITKHVINRLRYPSDGDILVPGGTVSILGTTSVRVTSPDGFRPTIPEVDLIVDEGAVMIPELETTRYIRAYAGIRPLVEAVTPGAPPENGEKDACSDRSVSRGFSLIDHSCDGVDNLITITGGKLTTFRLMAEKAADKVCEKLNINAPCKTRTTPLPPGEGKYTEPGLTPRLWISGNDPLDSLLCECEMVSKSIVDEVLMDVKRQHQKPSLKALGLRSRVGKGSCQGGFCSVRICAHMYDKGYFQNKDGLRDLREFLEERGRGVNPILWGQSMVQFELQEALHAGLFSLELEEESIKGKPGGSP